MQSLVVADMMTTLTLNKLRSSALCGLDVLNACVKSGTMSSKDAGLDSHTLSQFRRQTHEDALRGMIERLGDDEIEVLHDLAARLSMGQRTYGKLDLQKDARDLDREAYEEDLDSSIYRSCMHVKRAKART